MPRPLYRPIYGGLIEADGFMIWPLIRFSYDTINYDLSGPAPSPPDSVSWLGTDDKGRDVLARIIYGFRISVLFGFFDGYFHCNWGDRRS